MAEWSNAPDSKSGVLVFQYQGFESLSLRQYKTFEPAERALKALRAPHRAGLFAMGS